MVRLGAMYCCTRFRSLHRLSSVCHREPNSSELLLYGSMACVNRNCSQLCVTESGGGGGFALPSEGRGI